VAGDARAASAPIRGEVEGTVASIEESSRYVAHRGGLVAVGEQVTIDGSAGANAFVGGERVQSGRAGAGPATPS
jgi:hypothetical protein